MSTLHLSDTIIEDLVTTFARLGRQDQLTLLNKLTESVTEKGTVPKKIPDRIFLPEPENPRTLEELCGSWQDDRSAEEIIEDLRRSRTPNLDRVNFD
jgi:hypothetical protein